MRSFLRKWLGCMVLCCLFISTLSAQTGPAGVNNGAVLWLDASDVTAGGVTPGYGTTLTTWYDKSGSGHNAVSSGTNAVKFNSGGAGDRPVVNFTRTSATAGSGMTVAGLDIRTATLPDVTIFAVYRPASTAGTIQSLWGNDNGGQQRYFNSKANGSTTDGGLTTGGTAVVIPGGAKANETRLVTAVYSSGANASAAYLNGKLISAFTDQTTGGLSTFKIGLDGNDNFYDGDISELIVYNRKLSACDIEKINIYLANKYATDFTDMASNYTLGIPYNNDINGVGVRTSACGGTYNISASFSGIVSVTNPSASNTGVILSFGDDRGGYGSSSQTPSTYTSRLQQVWRADLNGNIGTVDVCFELTGLGIDVSNTGNFALLIDKDGDFSNATVISTGITTLVNRVCISGVSLTKGDYFTLATRAATSTASEITSTNEGIQQKSLFTAATIIDDQILVKGSASITDGRVYVDAGFVTGDVISWGTLPAGVTASYNATIGVASFTGTASSTEWQNFYRTMKFNTTSGTTGNRTIRFVLGNVVSYTVGTKPHYYEYITTPMSWTAAKAAAEARTLYGLQGYLATITAQIENDFITSKLSSDGWVGGTCNYQLINTTVGHTVYNNQNQAYGNYYWVTGPEKGTAISTGLNNPTAVGGAYMKWNNGEPNNYQNTDEEYMQLYSTNQGRWNDLPNSNNLGYVVEYGGYASDPVLNIDYTRVMVNAPPAPVITSFNDDNGLSSTDNITNDATLIIKGTGQSSATITVYRADIGSVGTTTVDASGNWSFDYTGTTLTDGTYAFTATAKTGSQTSAASPVYTITIDRTPPSKPGQPALASGTGNASNDVTPDLTGSAEPGSLVKIFDGGTQIGTATTNASGQWSLTAPTMTAASLHNITVTATDVAGNVSVSSDPFPLTIDIVAPNTPPAPTLVGGVAGVTNDNTPTIIGKAEPNSTVTIYNGNTVAGTAHADVNGDYIFTFPVLADGPYTVKVTATDAAGNTSPQSPALTFTVDTQAPAVPTLTTSKTLTNNNTPAVTGVTDPNAIVTIYKDGVSVGTTTANASGNYTYTFSPALADGTYTITADARDAIGNTSAKSAPLSITVDTTPPPAPTITTTKTITNNNTPTVTGTAEPNSTVTIYRGVIIIGTTTANASGNYTYTFNPALQDATYAISATATDAAGNTGPRSTILNITVDTQAPPAPVVSAVITPANDNTPTVTGTAEPNSTVTVYRDGALAGTAAADASGNWTYTFTTTLSDGLRGITATATDAAGNTGPMSAALNILIDTQAPAVPTLNTAKTPTNDNTPDVFGKAEANSTVTIYVDGNAVGTTNADASGNYTFTTPTPLSDGTHTFTATSTDAVGNTSASSASLNITIDTQAPAVPTITTAQNPTADNTPTVTGKTTAGSTVTIYVDGNAVGTTIADGAGNYTFTVPTSLSDGIHAFTATATDAVGNTSAPGGPLNINIDTQAPAKPTITTAQNPTADNTPTLTGTAEANSTVTIYVDGNAVGTTVATAGGTYTFTVSTPLADGTHTFTATATDVVGNTSVSSDPLNIKIDTQAPAKPTITTAQNPTADNTPTVTGTAEANSTVTIYVDGNAVGTTVATAGGTYTFTVSTPLADGTHTFTATATDAVGNTSVSSDPLNITIDTQAPAAPTVTTVQNPTADNTPTVTGKAEANSTVNIYKDGALVATVSADPGGNYTYTFTTPLADGTYAITATATDAVGNTSVPSAPLNITIDTQKPVVPTITTAQNPTADNTPTVTGTAEANSTITIYVDGNAVGTTIATAGGAYTFTVSTPLADGTHAFTATATDAVGNTSDPSATLNILIDTQKPVVPTITTAQNPTADNTPTVTGTAEANSTVTIYVDGNAVGTTTATAGGTYTFTVPTPLADGTHAFTATATDVVGNTSDPSATLNILIDTQKPVVPTITTAQNPTSDNTPTVTGTAEANSTVTIYVDGNAVGTTTATAGGTYTFTVPTPLADGTHAFTATATDAVGNTSAPSATLDILIDTQKPVVPTITTAQNPTADNTPTVTGTAEANSTVTIYVDGNAVGTTTATAGGTYTFTVPTPLADGTHAFTATTTDAVGNTSAPSATLNILIDTQKPVVPTIATSQNPTADNTPTVTGAAEANSTVTIYVDGNAVGTTTATAGGTYTFTVPTPLADGTHAFTATATDAVGNTSDPSATLNILIDTQKPVVPTITTSQNPTADNTPTVTGTAEANSTVTIYVDGSAVGNTTADASGNYAFTVPTLLADGTHAFTATATDAVGNTSAPSATLNILIDTQKPVVPTITTAQNPTSDNTPTVTGTAEANSTVTIYVDGNAVGTTTADASGNYSFTVPTPLSDGTHAFTATSTDAVGNTSDPSATLNILIDTQKPVVPTITTAQNPTADNTPTVTGTAEANSTVTIYVDGNAVGTTTADASGNYSFTVPTPLADGTHAFTATATDAVGNTSDPSATLTILIDTQKPGVPTITTPQNPTADNTPTVTGTAEANSTVTIYVDGNAVGTTTATAGGTYTFTVPTPLSDGTHAFTATSTDAVGNTSDPSATLNILIDTQKPVVPTITTAQNPTADNTPTVTGTAEANSTVAIYVDGNAIGTTTATAGGTYTFTVPTPLSDGTHAFTATSTDAVGNTSDPSATLNILIDTQKPVVPTITTAQNPTADNTPTVTGTAEANSTVTIYVDGNAVGTTTADASGNYSFTVPTPLADGTHAFTATATDAVGNTSDPSATLNILIDTQKPVVPTITTAQNPTSDNTPTVTGTAEANSTVTIYVDGNAVGTTTATAGGAYTFTVPTPLADGTHAFTATATDAVGNTSAPSATLNILIDTQKPVVPTITTAQNPTADNTPTVTGTAEANSTVTIYVDGNAVGTTTATAGGTYTFSMPTPLSDGTHAFTATSTDAVGNTSVPSATLNILIDTQKPVVPTITTAQNPTADNTPTVTGTAEANSTVTIYVDGNAVGTTTADASGNYTFTVPNSLSDGTHAFTATSTDAVSNTSTPSAPLNITIDTQAPAVPTITTDKLLTSDNTPTVTGTAEANSTVTIYVDGNAAGTTIADASGNYTFTVPTPLSDGTHAFTATATDKVGNTSQPSAILNVTVDTKAPNAPTITTEKALTNDNTPTVTGTAEANSTVTIYVDGSAAGTTTADASGNYTFTVPTSLSDGTHAFTATATDKAGNTSQPSTTLNVTIDTKAPDAPTITTDKTPTSDNTPTVTGKAEANSTVTIYQNGNAVGTTTADANGNYTYTFTPALADGSYVITATATDAAGNTSAQSPALNITIDAAAPATPAAPQLIGGNNGIISDATPSIKGDAEANSTVTVYVDGKPVGTTKADANGHYTYTFDPALADGPHNITVTATDATGNTSGQSPALAIVIDTQAPAVPTITTDKSPTNDNTPTVTGKAEPNSTVTVYVDGKPAGTTKADNNGNYSYTFNPALSDGKHDVTATATDAAGNSSAQTPPLSLSVDTKAPDAPTIVLETASNNGVITTTRPTISGAAEANSTVTIYADGVAVGTTTADANGHYTYTFNPGLSQGEHNITATATDAAGNTSQPGGPLTFSVDAVAPDIPSAPILPGINIPGLVNTGTPTITGKGEPGTAIIVYTDDKMVGIAIVDKDGNWTYTYDVTLTEGPHNVSVTASDRYGNESAHSSQVVLTVDLTRPEVSLLTLSEEPLMGPVTFTFTFSEDVIGFASTDILLTNGTITQFKQLSPTTYEVIIMPEKNGELTVRVPANVADDLAGNSNKASSTLSLRVGYGSGIDIVYPMPATDVVNVRFNGVNSGDANVTMTSMAGQVLMQQNSLVKNGILTLNTQRIPSGTYVLYIRMKEHSFNTTVVIAR